MVEDVFGIVGTQLAGAYLVEQVVAEGGFGVVYRAQHTAFRASVALKCLKIPQGFGAAEKGDFLEQFRAEGELLFRLSASLPTVVRPLHVDAFTSATGVFVPFMVLEWLEGETLDVIAERRRARGHPLTLKRLMRLLEPVAEALDRAHDFPGETGRVCIVHRDLKPENIFVASVQGEETAKILDFGIGKVKGVAERVAGHASQRDTGWTSFSPAYGAPEQWAPRRYGQTGPWTDVWGLALTMVEVLAGHPVIDGDEAAMMGTALDPVRRPTPRREGVVVNDDVEAVFETALAVDPRTRYQLVRHFWGDLIRAVGGLQRRSSLPPAARGAGSPTPHPGLAAGVQMSPADLPPVPDLDGRQVVRSASPRGRVEPRESPPISLELDALDLDGDPLDLDESPLEDSLLLTTDSAASVGPPTYAAAPPFVPSDEVSVSRRPIAVRSLPPARLPGPPPVGQFEPEDGFAKLLTKLLPGAALAVGAIAVSIGGQAYAVRTGTPIPVGWLAGALLLVGIGITIYRFLPGGPD
jgi:serine/threonine protein kinase